MAEYINRAEVLKEIIRFSTGEGSNTVCSQLYRNIGNMPTIDITMDLGLDCYTVPDHLCADGERRTE